MMKPFLEIGKIVGTHGVRGEMRVQPWCDNGEFFKQFSSMYFDAKGEKCMKIVSVRPHGNVVLLKLEGVDTVEAAAAMRGRVLFMDRNEANLDDDTWFIQDLIGCEVLDADDGRKYGTLSDVSETGANDVWHVKGDDGKEYLLPAIPPVVIETDVKNGVVKIRPMKGIFDEAVEGDK